VFRLVLLVIKREWGLVGMLLGFFNSLFHLSSEVHGLAEIPATKKSNLQSK
jgi:hypothetical protein